MWPSRIAIEWSTRCSYAFGLIARIILCAPRSGQCCHLAFVHRNLAVDEITMPQCEISRRSATHDGALVVSVHQMLVYWTSRRALITFTQETHVQNQIPRTNRFPLIESNIPSHRSCRPPKPD